MAGKKRDTPANAGRKAVAPAAPVPTPPPSAVVDPAAAPGANLQPGEALGQLAGVQLQGGAVVQLAELPEPELRKLAADLEIEGAESLPIDQLVAAIQAEEAVIPAGGTEQVATTETRVDQVAGGAEVEPTQSAQPVTSSESPQPGSAESQDLAWVNSHRIPAVRIRSVDRQGLRRAGRRFGPEWQTISLAELDDDQAEALAKEPGLVIEPTYIDPAELS